MEINFKQYLMAILFFMLIAGVFISCKNKSIATTEIQVVKKEIDINLENVKDSSLDIGKYYPNVTILPLKGKSGYMVGEINKVVYYKDRIYVLDRTFSKALLIFDKSGNPIDSIKDEFILDFAINNDIIYVLRARENRINMYDVKDNSFVKGFPVLPQNIMNIEVVDDHILCYRLIIPKNIDRYDNCSLFLINKDNGEVLKQWLPINEKNQFLSYFKTYSSVFRKVDDLIYFSRNYDNNQYCLKDGELVVEKLLQIKNIFPFDKLVTKNEFDFVEQVNQSGKPYSIEGYFEIPELDFFRVINNNLINSLISVKSEKPNNRTIYKRFHHSKTLVPFDHLFQVSDKAFGSFVPTSLIFDLKSRISHFDLKTNKDPFVELLSDFKETNLQPVLVLMSK